MWEYTARIAGWKMNEKRLWAYGQQNSRAKGRTIQEHVYHFENDQTGTLGTAHVPYVLVIPKSTNTHHQSMKGTSQELRTMETSQKLQQTSFLTSTVLSEDSLAKLLVSLENEKDLKIPEERSFLTLREYCEQNNLDYSSLKMLKDFSATTTETLSKPSSPRLMNWGMTVNGKLSTARITESHKTESGLSLSDTGVELNDLLFFQ